MIVKPIRIKSISQDNYKFQLSVLKDHIQVNPTIMCWDGEVRPVESFRVDFQAGQTQKCAYAACYTNEAKEVRIMSECIEVPIPADVQPLDFVMASQGFTRAFMIFSFFLQPVHEDSSQNILEVYELYLE